MKIIVAPAARRDLERQLTYLIDHNAATAARRLEQRLVTFVERTLAAYPRAGIFVGPQCLRNMDSRYAPRPMVSLHQR